MRTRTARVLLVSTSAWLLALACGARSGLPPGHLVEAAGGEPSDAGPDAPVPECVVSSDCLQPQPGQCGVASCLEGVCSLAITTVCDDGDPCTVDSCQGQACSFIDARIDADGDGAFAQGSQTDPNAALGCGRDCDDTNPKVYPGAIELCDSIDNDCNGIADDGTRLEPSTDAPVQVSPPDAERAAATGLAFDGERFAATMTLTRTTKQGHFRLLDARGNPLGDTQRIARVNAESYGGQLVWTGQHFLTAYEDARQSNNYEIYFDLLNRDGMRLIDDLRVTEADDFSLNPALVWTGSEGLVVWDDRRFEAGGGGAAVMGQRISAEGKRLGDNIRLTPETAPGESASVALSDSGVGIAFVTAVGDSTLVRFIGATRQLERSTYVNIDGVTNAAQPSVAAVGDKFVVTFHQEDVNIGPAIFGAVIGGSALERGPLSMTSGGMHARSHATYSYGDRFVMVWADDKDGPYQLYAQTFDARLSPLSPRLRVVSSGTQALNPVLAPAADGGLGILYEDEGSVGKRAVYFTRLNCQAPLAPSL